MTEYWDWEENKPTYENAYKARSKRESPGKVTTTYHRDYIVDKSYEGLRKALSAHGKPRKHSDVRFFSHDARNKKTFCLKLAPGTLERLSPRVEEGWWIKLVPTAEQGTIVSLDYDRDHLYVSFNKLQTITHSTGILELIEHDFLSAFRDWLETNQGRALPELWQNSKKQTLQPLNENELGLTKDQLSCLRQAQLKALKMAGPGISYIWGAPGTGKTFTLADLAQSLINRGYKVLLLASSNVAVDRALLATLKAFKVEPEGGYLARMGHPKLEEVQEHPLLIGWAKQLEAQQQKIVTLTERLKDIELKIIKALERQKLELKERQARLKAELLDAKDEQKELLRAFSTSAHLVATTVYTALHDRKVLSFMSASKLAILIDEASNVARYRLLPFLEILKGENGLHSGTLTTTPSEVIFCITGDPLGLNTIFYQKNPSDVNERYWLGESLIEELLPQANAKTLHNLTLLHEQSRIDPSICRRISAAYYEDMLRSLPDPKREQPPLVPGWPEDGLVLVDPNKIQVALEAQGKDFSTRRYDKNERNLWVTVHLIEEALGTRKNLKILWLAPFHEQIKLAFKLCETYFSEANVQARTIHSSQSLEADLVIFDPVNVESNIFNKENNPEMSIKRLLNAAVSRARSQILVLCSANKARKNSTFWALLHDASRIP